MNFWITYGIVLAGMLIWTALLWLVSLKTKRPTINTNARNFGFVIAVWVAAGFGETSFAPRALALGILVTVWGLSSVGYAVWRDLNWQSLAGSGAVSDRTEWWSDLSRVVVLRGFMLAVMAAPLTVAAYFEDLGSTAWIYAGIGIWAVGFFFEAGGNLQLARFKTSPLNNGKLTYSGLWRYSRHPDRFGNSLQWWAFFVLALTVWPWGLLTVFSPLMATFGGLRLAHNTALQQRLARYPGYLDYLRHTSAFIPWPPRKPANRSIRHRQG